MFNTVEKRKARLVWQEILKAQNILLVSHLSPDVDALASLDVLIEIVKALDKNYLALAEGKKEGEYSFLVNEEELLGSQEDLKKIISHRFDLEKNVGDDFFKFFDLVIIVDCGSIERTALKINIEKAQELKLKTIIVEFDHHVPIDTYADIEIRVPLSSTAEVLYNFIEVNDLEINRNMANALLAGILSDTGNLLYPSVTSETLRVAAELLSLGAQFPRLVDNTWRNKGLVEMKLWGLALNNLRINKKYNIAVSVLSFEDLQGLKAEFSVWNSDTFGDVVGFLSNLSEADLVLLLREENYGIVKGSLRVGSVGKDIDSIKLAAIFGGGGHRKASGFMIKGHLEKIGDNNFRLV